jgi:hypothetical protein
MDKQREKYLLSTPREQLSPTDKRLQTILKKYGSVANSLKNRDTADLVLGGINGGRHKGKKGFSTWDEATLKAYTKLRERDERGRFVSGTDGTEAIHRTETKK